ncbi:Oxidoreductase, molybdopterin-binding domain-containing protein [Xylariomycetidae sp. FL0641]|nr:Oxidoreductase, molybdopterin-binding domain-containing protein [Xylariomycetidae sp. FL0641]
MSVPISRQFGRELWAHATRRPQFVRRCLLDLKESQPLNLTASPPNPSSITTATTVTRNFSFRTAFRGASSKAKPNAKSSSSSSSTNPSSSARVRPLPLVAAGSGILTLLFTALQPVSHEADDAEPKIQPNPNPANNANNDDENGGLPRYRLSEIKEHGAEAERPWVVYGNKVYDITDWIPAHPGGDVILRAAGKSIEPYWNIFSIHKSKYVLDILEQYVVGKVHPDDLVDGHLAQDAIEDPFESDPVRDPRLYKHTAKPCNAESPGDELAESFLTPNEIFYVRNHMWVPVVNQTEADAHGITVELPDGDSRTYSVGELKARFKQHTITAALQCSGNRRNDMTKHAKKTNGLQWTVGAISCAKWEGVRLRDVLADAGLSLSEPGEDAQHVQFTGLEAYGASIPISSAIDPRGDVLLAFRMNDEPLPRDHGFPVRVIVPGHVAARCVKWVNKIVISDEESNTTWQRRDYKCFGPNETKQDWDKYKSIQVMPITSAITRTRLKQNPGQDQSIIRNDPNASASGQTVQLDGYAYSGGGREIQRVDISLDGGETWDQAKLVDDSKLEQGTRAWCWKRWRYEGKLPFVEKDAKGEMKTTFVVKATDDAYNTQPETHKSIYNLRGNLATAWHRVDFEKSRKKGAVEVDGTKVAAAA